MWSQWINLGRGNANFFFGTSLGIVIAMSLLVSDIFLAHLKLDYASVNGDFESELDMAPVTKKQAKLKSS